MRIPKPPLKIRYAPIGFAGSMVKLELDCDKLVGGDHKGQYQAKYYYGADLVVWGDCFKTPEEAIADADKNFDQFVKSKTIRTWHENDQ